MDEIEYLKELAQSYGLQDPAKPTQTVAVDLEDLDEPEEPQEPQGPPKPTKHVSIDPDDPFGGPAETTIRFQDHQEGSHGRHPSPTRHVNDDLENPYGMEGPAETTQTINALHTINFDFESIPDAASHQVSLKKFGLVLVAVLMVLAF